MSLVDGRVYQCELCEGLQKQQAKYQCSRYLKSYCSLNCYKSRAHEACSEKFYENNVKEEMRATAANDKDKIKLLRTIESYSSDVEGEWKYKNSNLNLQRIQDGLDIDRYDLHEDELDRPLSAEEERELEELIENASSEELLRTLSPDQKRKFEELLQQYQVVD
jgi:hypothetical protein